MKPGYKQTEGGVIPEAWEVKTLGSLTTLLTNGFVGTATTAYVESEDGVLYIQGYNVQENGFNFHGIKRVSKAFHARNKKSCLQTGDLLTIQTGDIGVTTVVPSELDGANCHALIISRLRKQESEPGYYCQYFNSERGRVAFKEIETGTTMKHLNGGDMKRLFLPSPPVEEQRAIATALSDVDGLLGGLDRLIAKKRDLKQAAMQQLLTGQTRLPGFHGEWEVKRLGEVLCKGRLGGNYPNQDSETEYPLMKMGNIARGSIDLSKIEYIPAGLVPELQHKLSKGDVLFNTRNTLDLVGKVGIWRDELPLAYYNSNLMRLEFDPRYVCSNEFANAALNTSSAISVLRGLATGTTSVAAIYTRDLLGMPFSVPPLFEQTAIATVLTDMDAELGALEQRLAKTRALKLGMMQELLTGRTRLV